MNTEFIKILLVEDDPDSIQLLQDELMSGNGNIEFRLECVDRNILVRSIRYSIERHQMIKKLEQTREELQQIAHYDSLTGLSNRKLFYEQLDKLMERVRRENKIMAVMFLDLDNFKTVNDVHGHSVGDLLLQSVAKRITSCLRKNDIAARLGGDEFI